MAEFLNPDETVCDCGHTRESHRPPYGHRSPYARGARGLICLFRDPVTDEPCPCNHFTITIPNLPGRLTEGDIVDRAARKKKGKK
jgi:hypothetical protein